MTPSKDTLEAGTPFARTATPVAAPSAKTDLNKMRADAVSLDVPVKVHGSRVTEVPGAPPNTEPFEEDTSTMIVFPNGGVLRMATTVSVGQMLVVTNQRSRQDAICRVLKVRAYSNTQAYVEVEFTHRQPGYWGVHFPTDDDEATESFSAAPPAPVAEKKLEKPVVPTISMKVEGISKAPAAPARSESAFTSIGTHEDIQPSASSTEAMPKFKPAAVPPPAPRVHAAAPPVAPVAPIAAAPVSLDLDEEEPVVPQSREPRSFGSFAAAEHSPSSNVRMPNFGSALESSTSQHSSARSGNWKWMAACAAFLVVGVAGGAFYFRQHSASVQTGQESGSTQVAENSVRVAEPSSAPVSSVQQQVTATNAVPASSTTSSLVSEPVVERPSRNGAQSAVQPPSAPPIETPRALAAPVVPTRELKPAPNAAPGLALSANNNFHPLSNRPLARRNGDSAEAAAPAIGVAPSASGALPGLLGSANVVPAPTPAAPPVGASVLPKLVHSVAPVYPSAARQAGVFGNVVIQAQVDKQGNVASTKVVSGPPALQLAAMTAVKEWKYQPAMLDGAPVPAQVTVTIRFQQQ